MRRIARALGTARGHFQSRTASRLVRGAGVAGAGVSLAAAGALQPGSGSDRPSKAKSGVLAGAGAGAGRASRRLPQTLCLAAFSTVVVAVGAAALVIGASRFKTCPPNQIMVVYGRTSFFGGSQQYKCLHGGGAFIVPVFQQVQFLSLRPLQIEIDLKNTLTSNKIRVNVPSVFTVAIGTDDVHMNNAAQKLLGLTPQQIEHQSQEIIYGQLRDVIATMTIDQINGDRDLFSDKVQQYVGAELSKLGLTLLNVNFTDITDVSGVIDALGQKAAAEARETARVDVAEKVRMGSVGEAEQLRIRDLAVAQEKATTEQGVHKTQMELKTLLINQERDMKLKTSSATADAVTGENEQKARIQASNAKLLTAEAEARRIGQVRQAEAEGAVAEAKALAAEKAMIAEAKRVQAEQTAILIAPARARKDAALVDAEAEAQKRLIQAEAEAKAVFMMAKAKADGIYAEMEAQAKGYRDLVQAAGGAQAAFQLMMVDYIPKLAEQQAQAVSNIKFDKVIVWDGGSGGKAGPNSSANGGAGTATADFIRNVVTSVPPLLDVMKNVGGVDMPDYFAKLAGVETTPEAAEAEAAKPQKQQPQQQQKGKAEEASTAARVDTPARPRIPPPPVHRRS